MVFVYANCKAKVFQSWKKSFSRVRIWSYSGPHFSCIFLDSVFSPNAGKYGKNTDQNNFEYGHFLRSHIDNRATLPKVDWMRGELVFDRFLLLLQEV